MKHSLKNIAEFFIGKATLDNNPITILKVKYLIILSNVNCEKDINFNWLQNRYRAHPLCIEDAVNKVNQIKSDNHLYCLLINIYNIYNKYSVWELQEHININYRKTREC